MMCKVTAFLRFYKGLDISFAFFFSKTGSAYLHFDKKHIQKDKNFIIFLIY